jgi:hypothetical protein
MTVKTQVQTVSAINALLGIWLIVAPSVLAYSHTAPAFWNDIIVGAVTLILAGFRVSPPFRDPTPANNVGLSWTNAALGAWLVIAPFALGNSTITANVWNDVLVGLIVLSLGAWSAIVGQRLQHHR